MSSTHQKLQILLLLVIYYSCSSIHTSADSGRTIRCLPDQSYALLQLKRSFHNPNLSSWQVGTDCCHWEGVTCDTVSGQVISLDLRSRNLQSTGGLNPALFNLTALISLDLSGSNLFGQIPVGIVGLKKLQTLDLSYNDGLYFRQPSFQTVVGNMSNLRKLYLPGVDFLDDGNTWSNSLADSVTRLQYLDLSWCSLSGPIHHSFSGLHSLEEITLLGNRISGEFPEFFADFSSLTALDLSGNDFEGKFPTKIFQLKNLQSIDVSWNTRLSGQLTNFPVDNNLTELYLQHTNFSGTLSTTFANLKFLVYLGLSMVETANDTGSLISTLPCLQGLTLYGSGLEKPNFSWIGNMKRLVSLELRDYNFSGPIHTWIGNLTSLTTLKLNICSFYGRIPTWIGNLTQLSILDISNNNLHGEIGNQVYISNHSRSSYSS